MGVKAKFIPDICKAPAVLWVITEHLETYCNNYDDFFLFFVCVWGGDWCVANNKILVGLIVNV